MDLFTLAAKLTLDDSDYTKGIGGAESKLSKLADGAKKVGTVMAGAVTTAAAAVAGLTKQAVEAYADYEQLQGGVETLFKTSSGTVMENAEKAFETAGMSANEYMETVTSFSASLIQSTSRGARSAEESVARATKLADMAVIDMSDNANKMGTDISSIQNAYNGFAKGNFTMLDNLKLGYGGTKEEMERLLQDAEKLTGKKYDLSSFADITEAIHAIQVEMGIAGTTAEEGSKTISGSANAMKAAWQNMLVTFADPKGNTKKATQNLVKTAKNFVKNITPVISQAISGIGDFLSEIAPVIGEELPKIIADIAPKLVDAGGKLIAGLAKGVKAAIKKVKWPSWSDVRSAISNAWNGIVNAVADLGGLIFGRDSEGKVKWPSWSSIKQGAIDLWNKLKKFALNIATEVGGLIFGKEEDGSVKLPKWEGEDGVKAKLQKFWDDLVKFASELTGLDLGNITSVSDAINKIWESWQTVKNNIEQAAIDFVTNFFGESVDPTAVSEAIKTIGDVLEAVGIALTAYFTIQKVQGIIEFFKGLQLLSNTSKIALILSLVAAGVTLIAENWDKIKPKLDTALEWLDTNIFQPVSQFFTNLQTWFDETISNIKHLLGLDWNERKGEGLLTRSEADELSADFLDAQESQSNWEKQNKLIDFYTNLQDKMKKAGFSAEEIAEALERVKEIKDYAAMNDFLNALTDSKTKAEELKSAVEAVPTDINVTAHINVDDPNGILDRFNTTYTGTGITQRERNRTGLPNAKGNWNVPYDNFIARLHRGEMVLTASQARRYRDGDRSVDLNSMFNTVRDAIREGMSGAKVNSYLNGRDVTDDVNRNTIRAVKARRFAT